jgi:hypothetical protein
MSVNISSLFFIIMNFTRYAKLYRPNEPQPFTFHEFIDELTQPNDLILKLRNETDKATKDAIKKELPGYVFAGVFTNRSEQGLQEHSGLAILDFDKIPTATEYKQAFKDITALPYIVAAWRSPSGTGFKALLSIPPSSAKEHTLRLRTFADQYGNKFLDLDADVCRFCFASYDPKPYVNEFAEPFNLIFPEEYFEQSTEYSNQVINAINDEDRAIQILSRFRRSTSFTEGQRNKFTFNIASQFCEYGVTKEKCIEYLTQNIWDAGFKSEGIKAVQSAYRCRKFNTKQLEDRTATHSFEYPFDIFPDAIRKSIFEVAHELSLNPVFLATAGLWTVSSLAGNAYVSDFNGQGKNILFCMLIAPVSVGKTPAFKSMCEGPLSELLNQADAEYKKDLERWTAKKLEAAATKQPFGELRPKRFHPFAVDGTTEGYIALCQDQTVGMGVYHDEAETILNAGSFKSNNDSISFFTQAFSGGRYTQIRADREKERVVTNMNINLLMGTQPSRLANIFTMDKIESGFASRFLMVDSDYIELNTEADPFSKGRAMCQEWINLVTRLYHTNKVASCEELTPIKIGITDEAKQKYRHYFKTGLQEANKRIKSKIEGFIIGTEAKMSAYLPRLTQVIAILNNPKDPVIDLQTVELGWKLYRYYAENTVRIISSLYNEVETGLPPDLEMLWERLPNEFTYKEAEDLCKRIGLNEKRFRRSLRRKDFGKLFKKQEHGKYLKIH